MIKALNISTQGLLQAEQRATEVAQNILEDTAKGANFSVDDLPENATETASEPTGGQSLNEGGAGFGDLIQHMVDLKQSEHAFKANAKAFKIASETLGDFLDEQG